jgi:macrodomain Ter protein organizer (MatP/YcbG family)
MPNTHYFAISDENRTGIFNYLIKKIKNDPLYLSHLGDIDVERAAERELSQNVDAKSLDAWCKKYLNEKQFRALRAAIRKRDSRKLGRYVNLEIDKDTYSNLNDLAVAAGVPLKDYVSHLINESYKAVKPPVAKLSGKGKSRM